jgi:glutaminyl-peptide cyclotransferase
MRFLGPTLLALAAVIGVGGARAGDSVPEFPVDEAWGHLLAQCALGPRVPGSAAHDRCLVLMEKILRERGGIVRRQPFRARVGWRPDSLRLTNLIARFGPPGEPIVIGAHWDSRPWADRDPVVANQTKAILGANDGASGVAVLLGLARVMGTHPPPVPVELVMLDGEDQGKEGDDDSYLLGSREHARTLTAPFPRLAIIIDMVGGRDLHICREANSDQLAGWLNDILFRRATELGLSGFEDRVCYSVLDDHVPYLEQGIPAVDLVDMHFPQWHTVDDVPRACSPESLGQVGRLLVDFLYGGSLQ